MPAPCSLSLDTLLDFTEARLSETESAAVQAHLATGCVACHERLAWITTATSALKPEPKPSLSAQSYALSLARLLQPQAAAPQSVVRHLARLVSGGERPRALARGTTLPAVQRVYETDLHLITLWDEPETGNHRYVIGQVYARAGDVLVPSSVSLFLPNSSERLASCEGSEFHLDAVAPGTYLICCRLEGEEILVPQIEVGSA